MNFPAAAKNRILAAVSGGKGNVRLSAFVGWFGARFWPPVVASGCQRLTETFRDVKEFVSAEAKSWMFV